jgi:hypothetical protein
MIYGHWFKKLGGIKLSDVRIGDVFAHSKTGNLFYVYDQENLPNPHRAITHRLLMMVGNQSEL